MRYSSQNCSCSFSYNITCPQLKVPNQPTITCPTNGSVLTTQTLNQCGSAIWAYGDTLAAVNGVVTGISSSLDAACTHACCFTRCQPCISYDLSNCPEVYSNPGTYYHRIRYVTASFEVSDFSDAACFCIGQAEYAPQCCIFNRNSNNLGIATVTKGTCGVNKCLVTEVASDSGFSGIITTVTCSGSCVDANCNFNVNIGINPNSSGEYLGVGTVYARVTAYGGYCCDSVVTSCSCASCIAGDLHVFAFCNGLNNLDACNQGSCCIQLYATYTHNYGYNQLPSVDTIYKFEVSPFCDFCSDIATACGYLNVFIPKSCLGGAGACSNYYVRACVLNNTIAPPVVRCVRLGNVTYPVPGNECNNPDCNTQRCCSGTINWSGPIAIYGIGSGGVGAMNCPCNLCGFTCPCCPNINQIRSFWCQASGGSGYVCSCLLENPGGCLNGCTFCLVAGYPNCGSYRCSACSCGNPSYFCVSSVLCVIACGAGLNGTGGLCGVTNNASGKCYPTEGYQISGFYGPSGIVKAASACCGTSTFDEGILYNCCNVRGACATFIPCNTPNELVAGSGTCAYNQLFNRLLSWCCTSSLPCCCNNYNCCCFPDTITCIYCQEGGNASIQANSYGLGGPGAIVCVCCALSSTAGSTVHINCHAWRGFGFGAGGPSVNINLNTGSPTCCHCYQYSGCASMCYGCISAQIWSTCCLVDSTGYLTGITGGAGGMMFMCNWFEQVFCCNDCWQGRQGMIVMACQGF